MHTDDDVLLCTVSALLNAKVILPLAPPPLLPPLGSPRPPPAVTLSLPPPRSPLSRVHHIFRYLASTLHGFRPLLVVAHRYYASLAQKAQGPRQRPLLVDAPTAYFWRLWGNGPYRASSVGHRTPKYIIKIKIHSSCEIEYFCRNSSLQAVCDTTPIARTTSCVSSLRI